MIRRASAADAPAVSACSPTHERMAANRALYLHLGWCEFEPEARMAGPFVPFRKPVSA